MQGDQWGVGPVQKSRWQFVVLCDRKPMPIRLPHACTGLSIFLEIPIHEGLHFPTVLAHPLEFCCQIVIRIRQTAKRPTSPETAYVIIPPVPWHSRGKAKQVLDLARSEERRV